MTSSLVSASAQSRGASRLALPLIFLLFVASGCAAMIYEVVWLQLLQLVIGSTAVSIGVLLGTFMGGMGAGGLLLPRFASRRRNPLRVYAALELGIALLGVMVLFGLPHVERVYIGFTGGAPDVLLRGVVAGICLFPPAFLMGATLPAVARRVESDPDGVAWLGYFYGGNIAGAVFGCLLAGFHLLRVHDVHTATYVAVALNVAVAVVALVLAPFSAPAPIHDEPESTTEERSSSPRGVRLVYLAIGLSGASALGAEVVWTRLLSLLLGATVYTFSLILAVFLIGLGIGSVVGAAIARQAASARAALGVCQWLLVLAISWTAVMISHSLPYWPILPEVSPSPWFTFQVDMARALWAVLPPACLWGASFPLALAAVAAPGQDAGRLVGRVYAANTIGALLGASTFSLLLVPAIGTAGAERVLIGLAATAGLAASAPLARSAVGSLRPSGVAALATAAGAAALLAWALAPMPWQAVAFGRQTASVLPQAAPGIVSEVPRDPNDESIYCTFVGEGANVSVAVTESPDGVRSFHGAGKVQASTRNEDMRLQRMLGHLPPLLHKKPETVLVVACGAGVTAGSFVLHPDVKRIVICDIEPLVPKVVAPMFGDVNYHVVDGIARQNPVMVNGKEVEVVYDDGRHFLSTTREKFDVITSDPIDPWVKGCAALNTIEYYQMCRDRLNPGGSVSLWMPLYESNVETAKSVIATFFQVFPNGILWSNDREGITYDAVLYGQVDPTIIDLDALQARLDSPEYADVKRSLQEVGFGEGREPGLEEGVDLLNTYAGQAAMLTEWTRDAQINIDRNLRLQYLAGMWLNSSLDERILGQIRSYYQFPEQTFIGSTERIDVLKQLRNRPTRWR